MGFNNFQFEQEYSPKYNEKIIRFNFYCILTPKHNLLFAEESVMSPMSDGSHSHIYSSDVVSGIYCYRDTITIMVQLDL